MISRRYVKLSAAVLVVGCMAFGCLLAAGNGPRTKGPAEEEAVRVGGNVLLYQRSSGGWPKNIDMARRLSEADKARVRRDKKRTDSTLDNGATYTQMRRLGHLYAKTKLERFKKGFIRAVDYLLEAQYPNGGWPQFYAKPRGYAAHITFNDGAMIGAMSILRDIAQKQSVYTFVDGSRRKKAEAAVEKGIECILKSQIIVNGKRTVWCAQHDRNTLEPRGARIYEKVSLSGSESVGVVRFLMSIDKPGPKVIEAIQGAVVWFAGPAKITGIRQVKRPDKSNPRGFDRAIVKDPLAPPIWARFYDIETNHPIFCGRDGKVKKTLAEIEPERRTGYSWCGFYPASLLARDYPAWQKKHAPGRNASAK